MITAQDTVIWLNYEERKGHLSNRSDSILWEVQNAVLSETERQKRIDDLVRTVHSAPNHIEEGEVYVRLAADCHQRRDHHQARHFVLEAARIYMFVVKDPHRQAVAEWLAFIILYDMLEKSEAHSHALSAKKAFTDRANFYKVQGNAGVAYTKWYDARRNEMANDLAALPEEAFEWLLQFDSTRMGRSSSLIRESVRAAIKDKCFTEAFQKIELLRNATLRSSEILETAEAQAFCGLSILQMGNPQEAVRYLRSALACSTHSSHRQASMRWMLGLILFSIPSERCNGINHMEASLSAFEQLSLQADRQQKPAAVEWYKTQMEAMKTVLNNKVSTANALA